MPTFIFQVWATRGIQSSIQSPQGKGGGGGGEIGEGGLTSLLKACKKLIKDGCHQTTLWYLLGALPEYPTNRWLELFIWHLLFYLLVGLLFSAVLWWPFATLEMIRYLGWVNFSKHFYGHYLEHTGQLLASQQHNGQLLAELFFSYPQQQSQKCLQKLNRPSLSLISEVANSFFKMFGWIVMYYFNCWKKIQNESEKLPNWTHLSSNRESPTISSKGFSSVLFKGICTSAI